MQFSLGAASDHREPPLSRAALRPERD